MMFHSLYLLIVLMSLAGNENNVALLGHHAGSAYSLATVDNGDNLHEHSAQRKLYLVIQFCHAKLVQLGIED